MEDQGGTVSPVLRARVMLVVSVTMVLLHLAHVAVAVVADAPLQVAAVVGSALVWLAVAAWAASATARGTGCGSAGVAVALAVGGVGITVDGTLSGSPAHVVLCAVGLTGLLIGLGTFTSPRWVRRAGPVLLACQLVLVLVGEGHDPLTAYVAVATTGGTFGAYLVVELGQRERRAALAALAESALLDPLTGLLNRRGMAERFGPLRAGAGDGGRVAVIALDLDHFKRVNDAHGHDVGDRVLLAVARTLASTARADDLVVRLGGEEFAWLGVWSTPQDAAAAAERLRRAVAGTPLPEGLTLTTSAGVAHSSDATQLLAHPEALSRLLVRADDALYRAKAAGRDRVELAPAGWVPRTPLGQPA